MDLEHDVLIARVPCFRYLLIIAENLTPHKIFPKSVNTENPKLSCRSNGYSSDQKILVESEGDETRIKPEFLDVVKGAA